jgi:hypothetical protein
LPMASLILSLNVDIAAIEPPKTFSALAIIRLVC